MASPNETTKSTKILSEGALLNEVGDAVDGGILLIFVGIEAGFHIHAEEFAECLPSRPHPGRIEGS